MQISRYLDAVLNSRESKTGTTPCEIVYRKRKARVYHYLPGRKGRHSPPILLIYALINKPYIFDLRPEESFIRFLAEEGFDVFLLDWWGIPPSDEDQALSFYELCDEYIEEAVSRVTRLTGHPGVTLLGYCMGGTMSLIYTALHPKKVQNLVCLTTPFDFSKGGVFAHFAKDLDLEAMVKTFHCIPESFIDCGTTMIKPVGNLVTPMRKLWEGMESERYVENWKAKHKWAHDGVAFPARAYREWINDFYRENRLARGELTVNGRRVNLRKITCPTLVVAAEKDHIAPVEMTCCVCDHLGSLDCRYKIFPVGHIGIMVGRDARKSFWDYGLAWLREHSLRS